MIASTTQSPSLKSGPSVQQGNQCRRLSLYSDCVCFSCYNSPNFLRTKDLPPRPGKRKQTEFYQFKETQFCIPATLWLLNTWTSFSPAPSLVEIIIHHCLIYGVFRTHMVSYKPYRHNASLSQIGVDSTPFTFSSRKWQALYVTVWYNGSSSWGQKSIPGFKWEIIFANICKLPKDKCTVWH